MSGWNALLADARAADPLTIAQSLGARLKKASAVEFVGSCPACGGTDRFSINSKKRIFNCRGFGGGDVIAMVRHIRGCSPIEAIERCAGRLRPDRSRDEPPEERTARLAMNAAQAAARAAALQTAAELVDRERAKRQRLIKAYIRELIPIRGTPGEQYLNEIRRIDTDLIADVLKRIDAIGWHPGMPFYETGHPLNGQRLGCIVGVMTDAVSALPTGAISRTYLDREGRKVLKAKTLGTPVGIVRLSRDEDVLQGLHLAEGLETALDAMVRGFRPMWSTGSTSTMAKLPILGGIECLTVIMDHDRNRAGEEAAREVEARWRAAGREVCLLRPKQFGDFNDAVRGEAK
jgi:Toprim domain